MMPQVAGMGARSGQGIGSREWGAPGRGPSDEEGAERRGGGGKWSDRHEAQDGWPEAMVMAKGTRLARARGTGILMAEAMAATVDSARDSIVCPGEHHDRFGRFAQDFPAGRPAPGKCLLHFYSFLKRRARSPVFFT